MADGRVTDTGNRGISHSEGQGFALLFAVAANDRDGFEQLWSWTDKTLRRSSDALFSWRYEPQAGVTDANNATDGDILIAWALTLAAAQWSVAAYLRQAQDIRAAIASRLVVPHAGRLLLSPGLEGFRTQAGGLVVNPSYYVFPALDRFAADDRQGVWRRVIDDGLDLLKDAQFGDHRLTPDWAEVDPHGRVGLAATRPPLFGFDAVRTPLYLRWSRRGGHPAAQAARRWWSKGLKAGRVPAWVDLTTGAVADFPASAGVLAIADLLTGAAPSPNLSGTQDYYSSALSQLAWLAARRA